jgi:hypothetical protein
MLEIDLRLFPGLWSEIHGKSVGVGPNDLTGDGDGLFVVGD